MLTDDNLVVDRAHPAFPHSSGRQRIYRFANEMGLSVVNPPELHHYPFAWEVAVLRGVTETGEFKDLDYSTPLTNDVEVFQTDKETNAFIAKAKELFS